ncbi:rRNA maturation RNase YbeY [Roseospira visakhapatnamensis]|uniref:Endoribonuclease YbeY n=1 Tax=Roseospira visakhapatnamensis TaxID=390880 RepID=A0A7W6REW5_9PROT|nr:rRNA maturation RNase YbeY [Roseospira visakhapatnamensis]MBB4267279.1 putative rRNA maturation factor [Roseospira visakhapatnamensis]
MTPAPTTEAPDTAAVTLEIDVMVEAPAWRGAVKGVEGLCRRAAEAAVLTALPGSPLADAPCLGAPGLGLCVVLEDDAAVTALNTAYRGRNTPTNVLAFAALEDADGTVVLPGAGENGSADDHGEEDDPAHLGDVIVAFETTRDEAARDGRTLTDHLAHLVVHGVLHLLGHDHQDDAEAADMESLETRILATLGIADPYAGADATP